MSFYSLVVCHLNKAGFLEGKVNARFTEQIYVDDLFSSFCKTDDSEKLSSETVFYT